MHGDEKVDKTFDPNGTWLTTQEAELEYYRKNGDVLDALMAADDHYVKYGFWEGRLWPSET